MSQHAVLCIRPEDQANIYGLVFYLRCLSGDNDSWRRANRSFLQAIRKELLIWNTLKVAERSAFSSGRRNNFSGPKSTWTEVASELLW